MNARDRALTPTREAVRAAPQFDVYLTRQIPVLVALSVIPGLGYILLGAIHDTIAAAAVWYGVMFAASLWGLQLYWRYHRAPMSPEQRIRWRVRLTAFLYLYVILWAAIFVIFVRLDAHNLHYIAIFTQIGATTVVAALLYPAPWVFRPLIPAMMVPLAGYFLLTGEWYGYVLSAFSLTLGIVLYYAANSAFGLLRDSLHQASHDALTGLNNRAAFIEHLEQTLEVLQYQGQHSFLLLIDLDHFKTVNDLLGHDIGDELLKSVTRDFANALPPGHHLARLGGDEFVIVAPGKENRKTCERAARRLARSLLQVVKAPYIIRNHHLHVSASIGIRLIDPAQPLNSHQLVREADIAMYEVKDRGRDGVVVFSKELSRAVERHLQIERCLHFALQNREIEVLFQPQVDASGRICSAETLIRWTSAELGAVSPAEFIPIAEQTGYISELGDAVISRAFQTLREWDQAGYHLKQLAINISPRQLVHLNFVHRMQELITRHLGREHAHRITLEVTEHVVAEDVDRVVHIMRSLRRMGLRFSMDDFGTGFSSLSYLKNLPFDELKIDRSFVQQVDQDSGDQAMVRTICDIARHFELEVVAEGVETEAQYHWLSAHGHLRFQGYLFARPMNADQFLEYAGASEPAGAAAVGDSRR
ncbi:bifunctional diguanylate cyclase/phosphodiesterase [Thioalkalivibrio sp. ALJ16]|uniref:putative bifunctional diguanylate cyclase/phosphodiesterase n=1 Tax=Thioalkalivibrio sp. ALJ16 TaxID=1158762 RepID=UPI00035FACB2|nr:GGDEF domain-containing phosphodiesterase [Thioalkalivibrio sp. ALJ16]